MEGPAGESGVEDLGPPSWFLIPERQDSRPEYGNGLPHEAAVLLDLLRKLEAVAGGATRSLGRAEVRGVWKAIEDVSIRYEVAIPAEKIPDLVEVLRWAAGAFGQECIYAVLGGTRGVLIARADR